MSEFPLPVGSADRNLLFGVLAFQLDFLDHEDLRLGLQAWGAEQSRSLGDVLVERGVLPAHRRRLLEEILHEYLTQHQMDPSEGLAAACLTRSVALDIDAVAGSALRGSLATLPTVPRTLPGLGAADPPPPSVGLSTSSGKRFRIVRSHARGALGEVFLARDEELNREVALKEIQSPYANNSDSRARFLLEAEITGGLEHPGIVPVYGLGFHPDGRPYYAMRFIRGESLYEAIEHFHQADLAERDPGERSLAMRNLLTRFVTVCNAISYAHARGVVHRDVKPSNIMLGPYGETLVVDWGLAKVFGGSVAGEANEKPIHPVSGGSAGATMLGQAVGTPSYMSPEQAAGRVDQVGPASDVYSLGATLYNILVGQPPFPGTNARAIIQLVEEHALTPPRKVKRDVPAALEAVVLKAMSLSPADRYASAHELAQEVERFLADEPVKAYPEPIWQQVQRWTRRHRTLVSACAVLLLTALVFLGGGMWFLRKEQQLTAIQRDKAEANLEQAEANLRLAKEAVDECFLLAKEDPLLLQEKSRGVRQLLLQKALAFYKKFKSQKPDDVGLTSEMARYTANTAFITSEIGKKSEALELCQQAHQMFADLLKTDPENDSLRFNLAGTTILLGGLQRELGWREKAQASYNQACQLLEKLLAATDAPEYKKNLAAAYNDLAVLLREGGKPDEALKQHQRARDLQFNLVEKSNRELRYQEDLAATQHNLGTLLAEKGDRAGALQAYNAAREIRELLAESEKHLSSHRSSLAATLYNLAALQSEMNQPEKALRSYKKALELREVLEVEFSDVPEHQSDLAVTYNGLGVLQRNMDETAEAIESFERAYKIQKQLTGDHPGVWRYQIDLAVTCNNLGGAVREEGDATEAIDWFNEAFPLLEKVLERDKNLQEAKVVLQKAYAGRADAWTDLKKHDKAVADWEKAVKLAPDDERDWCRQQRAFALARLGDHVRAMLEVEALRKPHKLPGEVLYNLACISALASAAAREDMRLTELDRKKRAAENAVKAMELLTRADQAGLFKEKAKRELMEMEQDKDLDSLRDRADFRKLWAKINGNGGGH